ncbi:MMPL family transporter [Verticiella sediminum]|uniref:MMPL family transporter n=1 Tax=Verticiella sediminum TaxID=1247510 RepID=A0A556ALW8_9BURK|nr:efflux RND transporter permease subunit [Verticiella sediminum]TSH93861.1 MMPL family transporter [Verticiella sediminum]
MLPRLFLERPVAACLMALAIALAGLLAWRLLPVAPLPEVDFPTIQVSASLPGASPESMASTVAAPLERALGAIAGVTSITSSSNQGATRISLQFDLDRDIHAAARDVQAAINAARGQLPAGMPGNPSYRKVNPSQAPILALALSSPNLAPSRLYDVAASVLAQKIAQVPGVGDVSVGGSSLPAVRVQLNPQALSHYGMALDEVRQALVDANAWQPAGSIESDRLRWDVRGTGQLRTAAEYRELIVRYRDGAAVRLGDVAAVSDSVENRYSSGFHNERPAVLLSVSRQPGANIVQTIDAIRDLLPVLRELLPGDAELAVVIDRSPGIRATLHEAHLTLVLACVLVVLVVGAFLGNLRAAIVPSLSIPVAVLGTFAVMHLSGFSLNNLSLMALIVATGLVVDDAVVVAENISRHRERGMSGRRAAMRGTREVGFTLIAMTLALVAVFASVLLMGGLVERLFREFSLTLIAAILLSLLLAVTLIPSLCAREGAWAAAPARAPRWQAPLAQAYGRSLAATLRHPWLAVGVLALATAGSVFLYAGLPKVFLPTQDTGQLRGFARGDDGFSFQVMQPKIDVYRRMLLADPAVADVIGSSGGAFGGSNSSMQIRLKPLAERGEPAGAVLERLRAATPPVPGGMFFVNVDQDLNPPGAFSESGEYSFVLRSGDLALLRTWAPRVSAALGELPELADVDSVGDEATLQVMLDIDREAAQRLGVDMRLVNGVLNNSFSQRQVATLYDALNQYRVVMEIDPRQTQTPDALDDVLVVAADGRRIPLSSFARHRYDMVNDRVRHDGQFAAVGIDFSLAPGVSLAAALDAIDARMAQLRMPTQVHAGLGEQTGSLRAALDAQPWMILAVLVAVYLVLGVLYESTWQPLTILSTLPSAGLGALLALRASGTEFSLIALLGLFLLIGVVMKNAILMVDFALAEQRRRGRPAREAIAEAARLRLRPILMTNCAALLGALPLVIGMGEGAELRRPLGITIVGGLAVSQLLTLYTTPAVYVLLDRAGAWWRGRARAFPSKEMS